MKLMIRKHLISFTLIFAFYMITCIFVKINTCNAFNQCLINNSDDSIDLMPEIKDHPTIDMAHGGTPVEQRGDEFIKWLRTSVKIKLVNYQGKEVNGSGTIIYFDPETNYAYVQSCGHLWSGNMNGQESKQKKVTCNVLVWYHNKQKLKDPKIYDGEVLYYSNDKGYDCSLIRFQSDWNCDYIPIYPNKFDYKIGDYYYSTGSDYGSEAACYNVKYLMIKDTNIITTENSPRPGRSGGGLLTDNYFIGVCWGTTNKQGLGNGLFTPISVIKQLNTKNGYSWLNEKGIRWARFLPIVNNDKKEESFEIPIPDEN